MQIFLHVQLQIGFCNSTGLLFGRRAIISIEFSSMPKNVIQVLGPSHFSLAKKIPISRDAFWIAFNEFEQTMEPAGLSIKKSSR